MMSIIAITGYPHCITLNQAVTSLTKTVKGQFEALNFDLKGGYKRPKTLYIRVSEKLDPQFVLERLKTLRLDVTKGYAKLRIGNYKLRAYLPDIVPDLPLAMKRKTPAKKHLSVLMKQKSIDKPEDIMALAHEEIMNEMQYKYTGLYELSKKNGHTLLEEITHTIFERLKLIMDTNPVGSATIFKLTQSYRRAHPHFGDFQLILSTLQKVQDLAGTPRTQITEQDICVVSTQPCPIGNIPYKKVKSACSKYSDVIIKKVTEHVEQLQCVIQETDTEEQIARKKVRAELKKLAPYMSTIIREVITDNFVPERSPYHRFRIYGEPFLPNKDMMSPFLKRYRPAGVARSRRMYNLLRLHIAPSHCGSVLAMDGTLVGGAKLVIRPSDQPLYKRDSFVQEMKAAVKQGYKPGPQIQEKLKEAPEDWNEPWE
ncbi:uncharacterized protein LOC128681209 isoform X2 [Plodia interpunctella]|uniref:uncharacterized protein LOC128681209 isoform X2 n=1 Tax=Plodia interpunctella TaxID=58824 RepID=UPI0023678D58|nr:uncharacterized protein LOC128681209 isoform X2 [Plodia interpunctella]